MLLTGFGPFEGSGSLASPPVGTWNPSAAAVLALDGAQVPVGTEAGKPVTAGVEGIVLPVEYEIFDRGTIERVVRPLLAGPTMVDAIITISQGAHTQDPVGPVRIERYAVGVRDDRRPGVKPGPVPAAAPDPIGSEIIESTAPVRDIAAAVPSPPAKGAPTIAASEVGEDITFRFAGKGVADAALKALGLPPAGTPDVRITDEAAIRQIVKTMVREANGLDLKFQAAGKTFETRVLQGPGGAFLSNEISYRVLRALWAGKASGVMSFHVHTPTAEAVPEDPKDPTRKAVAARSRSLRARLIETVRRIIAETGAILLRRRKATGGTP
jgi:hypothetical protein